MFKRAGGKIPQGHQLLVNRMSGITVLSLHIEARNSRLELLNCLMFCLLSFIYGRRLNYLALFPQSNHSRATYSFNCTQYVADLIALCC